MEKYSDIAGAKIPGNVIRIWLSPSQKCFQTSFEKGQKLDNLLTTNDARMWWLDRKCCKYLSVVRSSPWPGGCGCGRRDDERLASSASESSLINDRESPRKWQSPAPPASCHDDRSWIILTLDKWNVNTALQHQWGGAPIFAAPVTIGLISSIHHTREREGEIFELAENYWGKVNNDIMTPGLRGCHLTYLYIPGQCFSPEDRITGDPEPVQWSYNPIHIYYNIRQGLGGQALVMMKLVHRLDDTVQMRTVENHFIWRKSSY